VTTYEKAIQTAFREVADGLAARATFGSQLDAQRREVRSSQSYLDLATKAGAAG
jgi:multidrug efflux system outer membrane protein